MLSLQHYTLSSKLVNYSPCHNLRIPGKLRTTSGLVVPRSLRCIVSLCLQFTPCKHVHFDRHRPNAIHVYPSVQIHCLDSELTSSVQLDCSPFPVLQCN